MNTKDYPIIPQPFPASEIVSSELPELMARSPSRVAASLEDYAACSVALRELVAEIESGTYAGEAFRRAMALTRPK